MSEAYVIVFVPRETFRPKGRNRRIRRAWASPDPNSVLFGQPEFVALFDAEGVVELHEVSDDAVAAEFRRRVRIRRQLPSHGGVAVFRPPDLGPADEESLWAGEAV